MTALRALLLLACTLLLAPRARAQDDGVFALDTVLVSTLEATPDERAAADRITRLLGDALAEAWMVFRMADVPAFQDYDADIYVQACPPGQYVECTLVVGARVGADWVLGGQLWVEDGVRRVRLSFVDVRGAQLVLQFEVTFDGSDDAAVARGVLPIFADMVGGAYTGSDIRRLVPEGGGGEMEGGVAEGTVRPPESPDDPPVVDDASLDRSDELRGRQARVTRSDVAAIAAQEGQPPWDRAGLSKESWRRWRNSDQNLRDWKLRARGRRAALLVGATAITVGQGPWTQTYEGWYALDGVTLDVLDTAVQTDTTRGIERSWDFSLGAGITPWLDVTAFFGPRVTPYQYRIQRLIEGQDTFYEDPQRKVVTTLGAGGRITFAPGPTWPVRPTAHLGAWYWQGTRSDRVLESPAQLEVLPRPWMALVQGGAGFEVDVARWLLIWGRLYVDVPVAGRVAQQSISGGALLVGLPQLDTTDDGVGIAGSVGLTARIHLPERARRPR